MEEKNVRIKQSVLKFIIAKFVSFDPKKLIDKIEDDFDGVTICLICYLKHIN